MYGFTSYSNYFIDSQLDISLHCCCRVVNIYGKLGGVALRPFHTTLKCAFNQDPIISHLIRIPYFESGFKPIHL